MRLLCGLIVWAVVAGPSPAAAQPPPDPVRRGFDLLYQGDRPAAQRHFEGLLAAQPESLPVQFALLMIANDRVKDDPATAPDFERRLDAFISATERRYHANRRETGALFHLAQAHMLRASYRFEHDKGMLGAARDGAKAKNYSETYIKAHPDHADAYLTLGLYNYFVDLAPTFAKVFRFLLFLPAGNRVEGLKQIERAAAHGPLFGEKAERLLVQIYGQLEGRPQEALAIAVRQHRARPASDDVAFMLAGVHASPAVEDRARAAAVYQEIIARRAADRSLEGVSSRASALRSLAFVRVDQWRIQDAIATLTPTIEAPPAQPDWVLPQFLQLRANYRALLGDRAAGDDARRVRATPAMARAHESAATLLKWIDARLGSKEAEVYAALIPGNRHAADGQWDAAQREYALVQARFPNDAQVRLRVAQLQFLRGDPERALPTLTALASSGRAAPDWLKASALLYLGRAHDLAGRRAQARQAYEVVVDKYENERASSGARLGLITPYKRPTT